MPELFPQKLKANFPPEQQDYYLRLANELKELLNGQTQEEVLASGDPKIIQKILKIKQEMLNFVLTKKTREMVKQEEKEQEERILRQRKEQLEKERQTVGLDEIERKQKAGEELTDNELKFLYRIDGLGLSFSSSNEDKKRVEDIINQRNIKEDVSYVLGCSEDQVSLTTQEFLAGTDIVYHFGFLDLRSLTNIEGVKLPQIIGGGLYLGSLTSAEGLQLPQSIAGSLYLSRLTSAEGLQLPQIIGGSLDLESITSAEGLQLPQSIGGWLDLSSITSAKGLQLPQSIGEDLYLNSLTSAEGLQLPQIIAGSIYLGSLTSAEGLQLPQSIGGNLDLSSLTSAEGLQLPQSVGGNLNLNSLTSVEGLEIPLGIKSLCFEKMSDNEIEKLKQKYPHITVTKE